MFKPDEPSMFDEIQTAVFASPDKVGKVFRALGEKMRLCLVCEEVFTVRNATRHSVEICYPSPPNTHRADLPLK
jgi:hypothetical protein